MQTVILLNLNIQILFNFNELSLPCFILLPAVFVMPNYILLLCMKLS